MRLFAGRRLGPVFVGGSVGPFHPSRIFLTHGANGYGATLAMGIWGYGALGAALYFCWWCQH